MAGRPTGIAKPLVALIVLGVTALSAVGQPASPPTLPEEGRLVYRAVPDILVRVSPDRGVRLSQLWSEKPLLITLVFSRCAGVCSPFLRSLVEATARIGGVGADYRVVVLSFDPDDTLEDMQCMAKTVGVAGRPGWLFGTASAQDIRRLADSMGFWFRRVEGISQYDHPAMLAGVRNGRVLRILVGANVSPRDLRLVVREIEGDIVLSYALPDPKIPFRCLDYDPSTGRSRLDWGMLVLMAPSILTLLVVLVMFTAVHQREDVS